MAGYDARNPPRPFGEWLARLIVEGVTLAFTLGEPLGALPDEMTVLFNLGRRQGYEDRARWGDSTGIVGQRRGHRLGHRRRVGGGGSGWRM